MGHADGVHVRISQVVICCLTLIDPLAAVAGGTLLLNDGMVMTPFTIVAGVVSSLVAVAGVVFLSADYPADLADAPAVQSAKGSLVKVP